MPSTDPLLNSPELYRRRLNFIGFALIGAQAMYFLFALMMLQSGFKPTPSNPNQSAIILGLFIIGLLACIVSFPLVWATARRQPPETDLLKIAINLGRIFFVGFICCEVSALAGLAVFFLYGNIQVLTFLLGVTAVSLFLHLRRVQRMLEEKTKR